jgi:hypothetical protein
MRAAGRTQMRFLENSCAARRLFAQRAPLIMEALVVSARRVRRALIDNRKWHGRQDCPKLPKTAHFRKFVSTVTRS